MFLCLEGNRLSGFKFSASLTVEHAWKTGAPK